MGAPKLLMEELLKKKKVNLKLPLDLLARGIKLLVITDILKTPSFSRGNHLPHRAAVRKK